MDINKRYHKKCAVLGCKNSKKRIFGFPCLLNDNDRCLKWIAACGREDFLQLSPRKLREKRVCDLHFENRYRFPTKLIRDAVPTCNLPAHAASVKPQEETVMEITEEEEHQPVLTVGSQDNVGLKNSVGLQDKMELQDSVGLKNSVGLEDNVGPGTSRHSGALAYNLLPISQL